MKKHQRAVSLTEEEKRLIRLVDSAAAQSAPVQEPVGLHPINTIKYWLNAYSDPASGEHFMGHGMVVTLLREYLSLREATPPAQPAVPLTDDPLQGAVDWFLQADGEYFCTATVQRTLRIGYNRAKRLCDTAKERAAHGITEKGQP